MKSLKNTCFCILLQTHIFVTHVQGQNISDSEQLIVAPAFANLGARLTALCSSEDLVAGRRLSMRWSVSENNIPQELGECHSVHKGLTDMQCDDGILVTPPFSDGQTPYAISQISYTPQRLPVVFFCQLGGGEILDNSPTLRVSPRVENLRVQCDQERMQPVLMWNEPTGGADYYEVDVGNGWQNVQENSFTFDLDTSNNPPLRVRAINDLFGSGLISELSGSGSNSYLSTFPGSDLDISFAGCATIRYQFGYTASFFPVKVVFDIYSIPSGRDKDFYTNETITLLSFNQSIYQHDVDLSAHSPQSSVTAFGAGMRFTWQCGIPQNDIAMEIELHHLIELLHHLKVVPSDRKPEQLTSSCLRDENGFKAITLNWKHWVERDEFSEARGSLDYQQYPPVYRIEVAFDGGETQRSEIPINHSDNPESLQDELGLFPQSSVLNLQSGIHYRITITPDYHPGLFHDCENQSLNEEIIVPAVLTVRQVSPDSISLSIPQGYSAYQLLLFDGMVEGHADSQSAVAEFQGTTSEDLVIDALVPEGNYTVVANFSGSGDVPCNHEVYYFALLPLSEEATSIAPLTTETAATTETIYTTSDGSFTARSGNTVETQAGTTVAVTVTLALPVTEKNQNRQDSFLGLVIPWSIVAVTVALGVPFSIVGCAVCCANRYR